MPLPALATLDDYEAFTGRPVDEGKTAGVARLLELVSAGMRREMRQTITAIADDEITIRPQDGELVLPERPVTEITSITVNSVVRSTDSYQWDAEGRVLAWGPTRHRPVGWCGWGHLPIDIVYSHGYTEVPDDLVLVACSITHRIRTNPGGLSQESIDGYSYVTGSATVAEQNIMGSYRRSTGTTRVRR